MNQVTHAIFERSSRHATMMYWLTICAIVVGLYLTTKVNYLLFHTLVELFSVVIACTVFVVTWHSLKYIHNQYLIMVGISCLFIGVLDLLHTIAYRGMPIFTDYDYYANQLWIAARALESVTLIISFALLLRTRKVNAGLIFVSYVIVTALLISSIFYWKIFPVCFVAGKGLTDFKVYSEYAICLILVACILLLGKKRAHFSDRIYKLLLLSLLYTIISELAFTFYIDNYDISNLVGHYFKLFSFLMVYHAIIATGIDAPLEVIFKEIVKVNEDLQAQGEKLEQRIEERTSALAQAVTVLEEEIHERQKAELNIQRLNRLYAVLGETNHTMVKIINRDSLFSDFCRIAVESGGFVLAWIGFMDGQSGGLNVVASSGATAYLNDIRITANKEPEGEGPTGSAIREGTYYICNDFQNDPCTLPWHEQGRKYGIGASASIAIKENDQVVGALTLYGAEKNYFDVQHVELLLQMGMDISFALDSLSRENSRKVAEKALYEETTERLKAVEALREKEQLLIQQNRLASLGEMINNIAHQWRQPLNTLGIIIQQMQLYYDRGAFTEEYLEKVIQKSMGQINHMSQTIEDFRSFFRPDKEMTEFDIRDVIERTVSLVADNFNNQHIRVEIQSRVNPVIVGFPNEFSQVLLNILMNARDAFVVHCPAHGRIVIAIDTVAGKNVVTISDNAGGIPPHLVDRIFEPYFTTKGPDKGTGIGLFMAKSIIEKSMNGLLSVRNTGEGAEFRIEV